MPVAGPVGMGAAAVKADGKTPIVGADSLGTETNQHSSIIGEGDSSLLSSRPSVIRSGSSPRSTTSVRSLMVACRLLLP